MAALLPPEGRARVRGWWPLFLLVVLVLVVLVVVLFLRNLAPGSAVNLLDRLSPFHVGTPEISGTVVNAVTGRPVPGMDVCLLATYVDNGPTDGAPHSVRVMRSVITQTDTTGTFSFARWDGQHDLLDDWDGYGIAVIDPAAQWKEVCGRDSDLLDAFFTSGYIDVLQRERYLASTPGSAAKSAPPYFPVAMVKDPADPHPKPYRSSASFDEFPERTVIRKIGDPGAIKIALVPLLRDKNECGSAQDSSSAQTCRVMNDSFTAGELRRILKFSPPGPPQTSDVAHSSD